MTLKMAARESKAISANINICFCLQPAWLTVGGAVGGRDKPPTGHLVLAGPLRESDLKANKGVAGDQEPCFFLSGTLGGEPGSSVSSSSPFSCSICSEEEMVPLPPPELGLDAPVK